MIKQIKRYGTTNVITFPTRELDLMELKVGDIVQVQLYFVRKPEKDVQKETI